jgi:transposase InsO family protein
MLPSMSRPGNPYDNATCESFLKTIKQEEIYASEYRDFEDLRQKIEEFIGWLVGTVGIEPTTSSMPWKRAPS